MKKQLRLLMLVIPMFMLSMVSAGFASANNTDGSDNNLSRKSMERPEKLR